MHSPRFHPGQAVVCVHDFPDGDPILPRPKNGNIYHVTGMYYSIRYAQWGLHLAEFNPAYSYGEDSFAPIEELPNEALGELLEEAWSKQYMTS